MNQLKNRTLIVVIATIVTVVLILMTGRDATTISTDLHDETVADNETTQTHTSKSNTSQNEITLDETTKKASNKAASAVTEADKQLGNEVVIATQETTHKIPEGGELAVPIGPFSTSSNEGSIAITEPDTDSPEVTSSEIETKKTPQVIFVEPSIFVATSDQHQVLNHIIQPIWMDQKLGDFKSIETGEVVFKIMPTGADGLQGDNPTDVITSKTDKFSGTKVSSAYNYQQMPMYNGGYYISPMPSYLMPSMLPEKAKTDK